MPDGGRMPSTTNANLLNLPNMITFARLCAVPLAFWMILEHRLDRAFFLFAAAGISDAVDGWLARRYGGNALGALLDPLADKALLVTMYVTLAAIDALPPWLAILVVFRDVLIVGGAIALGVLGFPLVIRPLYISKLNTMMQIMLVAVILLEGGFGLTITGLSTAMIWTVALTTLASGVAYVWVTARGK
ncbi:MAG: CDP-alcohol phosphatidyltransferase family protein [Acetobacteraceae bacterium]